MSQDLLGVSSDLNCAEYPSAIAAKRRTGYVEAADVEALASALNALHSAKFSVSVLGK